MQTSTNTSTSIVGLTINFADDVATGQGRYWMKTTGQNGIPETMEAKINSKETLNVVIQKIEETIAEEIGRTIELQKQTAEANMKGRLKVNMDVTMKVSRATFEGMNLDKFRSMEELIKISGKEMQLHMELHQKVVFKSNLCCVIN